MAYGTLDLVQSLIVAYRIGSGSSVTAQQVEVMLEAVSDEVDAILMGHGVTTPLDTPPSFVRRLNLLTAYGVAAMVLKSAYPESQGSGGNPAWSFWETRYQAGLKALQAQEGIPVEVIDTGDTSASLMPSSYFTRNPDEEEELGIIEGRHMFTREMRF